MVSLAARTVYSPGEDLPDGGTMVGRIEIKNNRVYLYGEDPMRRRSISRPLTVTAAAFSLCRSGQPGT